MVPEDTNTTTANMWMICKPLQWYTIETFIIGKDIQSVMDYALHWSVWDLYSQKDTPYLAVTTRLLSFCYEYFEGKNKENVW